MAFYIGTSGWSYAHWTGVLYPEGTPPAKRLGYYLAHFATTELNASYYRWPGDKTFAGWAQRLPPGFRLSVKAPGMLTHRKRLLQPENWLARIDHSLTLLGERGGVFLVQLPPQFAPNYDRLAYFLSRRPPWLATAVEFRHPGWHEEPYFRLLEEHGVAYCVMSGPHLPCILRATAPFVYVRFHGTDPHHLYHGSYSDDDLRWWADRFREWQAQERDVWAYFNNDPFGHAVRNALTLKGLLGA